MSEKHFPLFAIRPGNPPQFTGPLARVLGPRMKHNTLAKTLASLSRLATNREMELLGMTTTVEMKGHPSPQSAPSS